MAIENAALRKELDDFVTRPHEREWLTGVFDRCAPIFEDMAVALIGGDQVTVDRLTRQALDEGFEANTILDDGLIPGMGVVGVKFRDNVIFVPEVLIAARAMK